MEAVKCIGCGRPIESTNVRIKRCVDCALDSHRFPRARWWCAACKKYGHVSRECPEVRRAIAPPAEVLAPSRVVFAGGRLTTTPIVRVVRRWAR